MTSAGAGFIIAGLIAAGVGLFFIWAKKGRMENAQTYSGKVIDMQERIRLAHGKYPYKAVRPRVRYNNGSRNITASHWQEIRDIDCKHYTGETVLIYADPRMPDSFSFVDSEPRVSYEAIAAFAAAAAFIAAGILMICMGF